MLRESVKIGGDVYAIKYVSPLVVNNGVVAGRICFDTSLIQIDTGRSVSRQKQTLWHEVVHSFIRLRGVEPYVEAERVELVVDQIAEGLHALMTDNGVEFWEVEEA